MKVDLYEYEKQQLDEVLKEGKYFRIEIVIPNFDIEKVLEGEVPRPFTNIQSEKGNTEARAFMILVLKNVLDYLQKDKDLRKIADLFGEVYGFKSYTEIRKGDILDDQR